MSWFGREHKPEFMAIDLETRSDVDLPKCGVYRYVEGEKHRILLFCYKFAGDPDVTMIDMASGEKLTEDVLAALNDDEIIKTAWNAQFERTVISHYLGRTLSPDAWQCTMVWAAGLSLPLSLKMAAEVLKVQEQKDKAGEALIRKFSVRQNPTKSNGYKEWIEPADDPKAWEMFKEYCKQDVRTEAAIREKLTVFPLPDHEWDYYHMDQRINDRGALIDKVLVEQAITCDLMLSEQMTKRAYELTGLENPNSVSQLKNWLEERGLEVDSLGKKNVASMIDELDRGGLDQEALDMLKLRLQMAKSSVKKYEAADRYICRDGRARGLFQFYGANRTGRFSGRGIQLQNLPQNHISTLDEARELVRMGCFDMVDSIYGNTPDILSQLIRTMLIPKPGCQFIVADFSAIEARVLAWEAGEEWRLEAFRNGADIYCASASQMFGVPVEKHGVNGHLRQKGKVAELACIAEGQSVLTDHGLVAIEQVTTDMKVWDGEEWVSHDGVIFRGERETITYEGLTATPDHLVWVEGQSEPVQFGFAATCGAHLIQTGDGGKAVRLGEDYQPGETVEPEMVGLLRSDRMPGMRLDTVAASEQLDNREIKRLPGLHTTKADTEMAGPEADGGEAEVREPGRSGIPQLWCQGNQVRLSECDGSRSLLNPHIRPSGQGTGDRQDQQRSGLRPGEYSLHDTGSKSEQQADHSSEPVRPGILAIRGDSSTTEAGERDGKESDSSGSHRCGAAETKELERNPGKVRVYDIRNAGRRHRFTVSGRLVHNCGYQGGVGALISMGALDMGLKESELPDIIDSWRKSNEHIVSYWWDVEKAATDCVQTHQEQTVRRLKFQFYSGTLWMVLPSGRKLAYLKPRLQPNKFGRMSLTFEGTDGKNKFSRQETYGGKLVENATQAIARDILIEAMWRMEKAGLDIVGHVHDEVILEVPTGSITVDRVCELMSENPAWCRSLPLAAAGYEAPGYYFKD